MLLALSATSEARCPAIGGNIQSGDAQFLTPDLSGRLAYLKDGANSKTYYVLDDCNEIYVDGPTTLNFVINNVFTPKEADGKASFVAVQVAKLQAGKQKDLEVTLERSDGWQRNRVTQFGFGPVSLKNLTPSAFFAIHTAAPFDDTVLKYKDWWWHATPVDGSASSSDRPDKWVWMDDVFSDKSDRVLLSNRLYRFAFASGNNSGVPFYVKINKTEIVYIRYFAPSWADEPQTYILEIR